jgi:hypothetical protein
MSRRCRKTSMPKRVVTVRTQRVSRPRQEVVHLVLIRDDDHAKRRVIPAARAFDDVEVRTRPSSGRTSAGSARFQRKPSRGAMLRA